MMTEGPGVRIQVSADLASPLSKRALGAALRQIGVSLKDVLVVQRCASATSSLERLYFHLHVRQRTILLARFIVWIELIMDELKRQASIAALDAVRDRR
jgi:hypothetical protein